MKNRILKMSSIILLTIVIVTINTISAFACQTNDESIKDITIIEERNNISDIIVDYNLSTGKRSEKTYEEIIGTMPMNYSENQITRAEPYFPIELESAPLDIIGEDDRIPTYNYAVCALEAKWDDGCRGLATAFMVGPNIALTSAHCIYSIETNEKHPEPHGMASSVTITPCVIQDIYPFQATTVKNIMIEKDYEENEAGDSDWALLILNDNVGESCGYFGFAYSENYSGFVGQDITVTGYGILGKDIWMQFKSTGTVSEVTDYRMYYNADTTDGTSGSPVTEAGTGYAVAINKGVRRNIVDYEKTVNQGVNITKPRFQLIMKYR